GVDSAAHRGAVSVGGSTIAVLGCGADIVYPAEHGPLARSIEPRGLIVSELIPGTPPLPRFFPQRNRIISGLSRAVVVVEAGALSGRNRGGHALLRDGARIVETADDILEELQGVGAVGNGVVPFSPDDLNGK